MSDQKKRRWWQPYWYEPVNPNVTAGPCSMCLCLVRTVDREEHDKRVHGIGLIG